jgi:hypothetical protein
VDGKKSKRRAQPRKTNQDCDVCREKKRDRRRLRPLWGIIWMPGAKDGPIMDLVAGSRRTTQWEVEAAS